MIKFAILLAIVCLGTPGRSQSDPPCLPGTTPGADGSKCYNTYGESCSHIPALKNQCNGGRSVICNAPLLIGGTCKCEVQEGVPFIFDDEQQRCESLAEQICHTYFDIFGWIKCADNSFCSKLEGDDRSRCHCNDGYIADEQKRCIKENGRLGDTCSRQTDCDYAFLRLACGDENTCQCATGYVLNVTTGTCVGAEGSKCSSVRPCQEGLICSSKTGVVGTCQAQ